METTINDIDFNGSVFVQIFKLKRPEVEKVMTERELTLDDAIMVCTKEAQAKLMKEWNKK